MFAQLCKLAVISVILSGVGAFLAPGSYSGATKLSSHVLQATVFDSEGMFEEEDLEKDKLRMTQEDLMQCFETGSCEFPEGMFGTRKRGVPYNPARDKQTYTVFNGDSTVEEEMPWSNRYYEYIGENSKAGCTPDEYIPSI
uniref:Uncharacterized protein n=1 Tax=Fibrocapsa japonica TaxID=94617 RepID=A0A7S2UXF8_9STRA|mmetsp:Transcript_18955/g.27362  ORF Transcript_18955/g.27362 Transcript_18955/m.27362 type:complete len:141 (+) Transcript_18955:104-526(+)